MNTNKIVLFSEKKLCCGCGACYSVCPMNAILFTEDEEGFLYPKINYNNCVKCKMCLSVCPINNSEIEK